MLVTQKSQLALASPQKNDILQNNILQLKGLLPYSKIVGTEALNLKLEIIRMKRCRVHPYPWDYAGKLELSGNLSWPMPFQLVFQ